MSVDDNQIVQLYLTDANIDSSNTFTWKLTGTPVQSRFIELVRATIPLSWYTFDNEVLTYSGGTPVLNGSFTTTNLPAILAVLFGATSCTISDTTLLINLQFGAPTTLNISQWSKRAQYFLGAGTSDLTGVNITFPYPVDLSGDLEVRLQFPNWFTNKTLDSDAAANPGLLSIPIKVNPFEIVYFEPPSPYFLISNGLQNTGALRLQILDVWGNSLNLNNRQGYIQYRSYIK